MPGRGNPRMKQDVERTCGKGTNLKRPRVKRTVDDEDDYCDEDPEQIFILPITRMKLTRFQIVCLRNSDLGLGEEDTKLPPAEGRGAPPGSAPPSHYQLARGAGLQSCLPPHL